MQTRRMTMAQALVGFLKNQYVERDGAGAHILRRRVGHFRPRHTSPASARRCSRTPTSRTTSARNEQAAVHIATAFAKTKNRLRTFACVSSIGPARPT